MSKKETAKVIDGEMKPYSITDSAAKMYDTSIAKYSCKDCSETFTCKYNKVDFVLTFFRHTLYEKTDFELVAISSPSPLIKTVSGIHIGLSERKFLDICKRNNYPFAEMGIDKNSKGYFFAEKKDTRDSKALIVRINKGIIISLMAVNMIGD
jgi:hypothetical protein